MRDKVKCTVEVKINRILDVKNQRRSKIKIGHQSSSCGFGF
jgi:hypothetical protein